MKKALTLTLFTLFATALLAQKPSTHLGKIRLGAHITPEFFAVYSPILTNSERIYFANPAILNFSGGIQAEIVLKGRLEAGLGLQYGTKDMMIRSHCYNCLYTPIEGRGVYKMRRAYAEMPFWLQYHVLNARIQFYLMGGAIPGLLVRQENWDDMPIRDDAFSISALAGLGMKYRLTDQIGVFTNIRYQHSLSNRKKRGALRADGFGFSFGVEYAL